MRSLARMTHTGTLRLTLIQTTLDFCPNVSLLAMSTMRPLSVRHNTFEKGV